MSFKLHLPLVKVILSVTIAYGMTLWFHFHLGELISFSWAALPWLLAGSLYTHLFEYVYHNLVMHHGFRIGRWRYCDKRHLRHHRIFFGDNFQTRQPARLAEVATHWYTLPALFYLHYFTFLEWLQAPHVPWFFLGVALQSLAYEITHWFTHVENNSFDRMLARAPLISRLRAAQIRHHRRHHDVPAVNFNFTPPYLGDRLGRTHSNQC
jgi:hypothetical protein